MMRPHAGEATHRAAAQPIIMLMAPHTSIPWASPMAFTAGTTVKLPASVNANDIQEILAREEGESASGGMHKENKIMHLWPRIRRPALHTAGMAPGPG